MPLSLYETSIPVFIRGLTNLSAFLSKATTYLDAQNLPPTHLLEARLIADMGALPYQIQRVSDSAKNAAARIAGTDPVPMPDDETTLEQLQARIQKTIEVLKAVPEGSVNGQEEREIVIKAQGGEHKFTARSYLLGFALPNFYFHVTTAYDLLRLKGVPVGKLDYLGGIR